MPCPDRCRPRRAPRAFALVEVVVIIAILGVLLAIFSLAAADSRRSASLSDSINNLKQYAWAGSTYGADCNDRFWTFSWTLANHPPGFNPVDDTDAAALQAWDILRRRGISNLTPFPNWVPHLLYSHLALVDQLNLPLPTPWAISPADEQRRTWQQCATAPSPQACFLGLPVSQRPSDSDPNGLMRWIFSSSYQLGPAFISRDRRSSSSLTVQSALNNHYSYTIGNLPLGDRSMTQVAFPSRKVVIWDQYQRYFGQRIAYYAYDEARVPLLLADGSAGVRATTESNPGFYPNIPAQASPLRFNYAPRLWEPPTLSGAATQLVTGYYQWTRGGLPGIDFGAPEICTGQPGCTP